jgi:hypothetical protein
MFLGCTVEIMQDRYENILYMSIAPVHHFACILNARWGSPGWLSVMHGLRSAMAMGSRRGSFFQETTSSIR